MSYSNYNHTYRRNRLSEPAQLLSAANLWTPTSDQKYMIGAIFETDQGERYKYCKNAATEIAKANLIQASAPDPQQKANLQTAYGESAGESKFDILVATGSGISDDDLIDGYLLVSDGGAAMGDLYTIKDHKWTTGDTVMSVTIADAGGLRVAIAATDDLTIWKNQCRDVIVKPTTLTGPIIGVTTTIVTASYYFWAKCKGFCSVICDSADDILIGNPVGHIDAATDAGAMGLITDATIDCVLGVCAYDSAVSEAGLFNLDIAGM